MAQAKKDLEQVENIISQFLGEDSSFLNPDQVRTSLREEPHKYSKETSDLRALQQTHQILENEPLPSKGFTGEMPEIMAEYGAGVKVGTEMRDETFSDFNVLDVVSGIHSKMPYHEKGGSKTSQAYYMANWYGGSPGDYIKLEGRKGHKHRNLMKKLAYESVTPENIWAGGKQMYHQMKFDDEYSKSDSFRKTYGELMLWKEANPEEFNKTMSRYMKEFTDFYASPEAIEHMEKYGRTGRKEDWNPDDYYDPIITSTNILKGNAWDYDNEHLRKARQKYNRRMKTEKDSVGGNE